MSPLVASPNRGYQDMQRIENWDSPTLYGITANTITSSENSGVLDVSRYAYLGGYDRITTGDASLSATWYTDSTLSVIVGARAWNFSGALGTYAQYRVPNLGPYAELIWAKIGSVSPVHSAQLIGTNRFHPLEFIPVGVIPISQQNVAIAATTTAIIYPSDYYAGPVEVFVDSTQAGFLTFKWLDATDVWELFAQVALVANVRQQFVISTPPGAWRAEVQNTAASAGNYYLACTPSTTGAI